MVCDYVRVRPATDFSLSGRQVMIQHFQGSSGTSYEEAARHVEEFLDVMHAYNIEIAPGGQLERACFVLLDLGFDRQNPDRVFAWNDFRNDLQLATGLFVLIRRLLECRNHPCFNSLIPYLHLWKKAHKKITGYASTKFICYLKKL